MLVKNTIIAVALLLVISTSQVRTFSLFSTSDASGVDRSIDTDSHEMEWLPSLKLTPTLIATVLRAFITTALEWQQSRDTSGSCDCGCGIANDIYPPRIVGGNEVEGMPYPWMAQLSYFGRFFCGGTLISPYYVLTAAHCADRFFPIMIEVTLGSRNLCSKSTKWTTFISSALVPSFSGMVITGQDIALLRLSKRAPIGGFIQPICLPTSAYEYANEYAITAGWGTTTENGKLSCNLRHVRVPILSNSDCFQNTAYAELSQILATQNMMCAGYKNGGADSCQGDSGGPLFVRRMDSRYEIVGVVSFGFGCARNNTPGIYTRVTKHLDWIKKNTRNSCFCQN